eukprot:6188036-Pleurochrysis_carterae.AAC.3
MRGHGRARASLVDVLLHDKCGCSCSMRVLESAAWYSMRGYAAHTRINGRNLASPSVTRSSVSAGYEVILTTRRAATAVDRASASARGCNFKVALLLAGVCTKVE